MNKMSGSRKERWFQRENGHEPEGGVLPVCGDVDHWIIVVVCEFCLLSLFMSFIYLYISLVKVTLKTGSSKVPVQFIMHSHFVVQCCVT
jgi:hypothetical protein